MMNTILAASNAAPAYIPGTDPASKLILVVDDDLDTALVLRTMLRTQGFQVQTAGNGKEAVLRAQADSPDIIIMDLMLPVLGGYEALLALRSCASNIPVIIHTARQIKDETIEQMRTEANVVGLLRKPSNYQILFDIIHGTLHTQRKME